MSFQERVAELAQRIPQTFKEPTTYVRGAAAGLVLGAAYTVIERFGKTPSVSAEVLPHVPIVSSLDIGYLIRPQLALTPGTGGSIDSNLFDRMAIAASAGAEALVAPEKEFPCRIDVDFRVARGSESFRTSTLGQKYVVWGHGSDPERDGVVYEVTEDSPLLADGSKPKDRNTKIVGPNQLLKAEPNGHQPCPAGDCIPTTQVYAAQLNESGLRYSVAPVASKPFPVDCTQPECDVLFWVINREKAPTSTDTPALPPTVVSTQPAKLPDTGGGPR